MVPTVRVHADRRPYDVIGIYTATSRVKDLGDRANTPMAGNLANDSCSVDIPDVSYTHTESSYFCELEDS